MNNGARSLALGNAFVALSENADAIFTNPAGLGRNNQLNLTISHQKLYGISNLYVGVPVKLGSGGAEEIVELKLNKEELSELKRYAEAVQELIDVMAKAE